MVDNSSGRGNDNVRPLPEFDSLRDKVHAADDDCSPYAEGGAENGELLGDLEGEFSRKQQVLVK